MNLWSGNQGIRAVTPGRGEKRQNQKCRNRKLVTITLGQPEEFPMLPELVWALKNWGDVFERGIRPSLCAQGEQEGSGEHGSDSREGSSLLPPPHFHTSVLSPRAYPKTCFLQGQ